MEDKARARPWPVMAVCVGWVAGTAWHLQGVDLQAPGVYAAGIALAMVTMAIWTSYTTRCRRRGLAWPVDAASTTATLSDPGPLAVAAIVACLAFCVCGWRAALQDQHRLAPALEGQELVLQGVITRLPQVNRDGVRFHLAVEHARRPSRGEQTGASRLAPAEPGPFTLDPELDQLPRHILLGWHGAGDGRGLPNVRAGDRWVLPVRLKAPHGQVNPHGFDWEGWLWSQGVMAVGQVRVSGASAPADPPHRLAMTVAHPVERWRQACRDRLWAQGLDPRITGLLSALLLGDQAAIDPVDWDVFRQTGVGHLMSISGLHITLLAAVARWLLGAIWPRASWRRRPLALWQPAPTVGWWGGWCVACAYALFSGWGLPAQRTVIMLGTAVLLRSLGTSWPWWSTWTLACALVLAWDPWAWLQAGFWLSFVAVGLLMALDDPARHREERGPVPSLSAVPSAGERQAPAAQSAGEGALRWRTRLQALGQTLGQTLRGMGREQSLMTLGLAPLTLMLFHEVSWLGWLANVVAIPWVTLCITPLAMLGVVWPAAWHAGGAALEGLQWGLSTMAGWGVPAWSVAAYPVWVAMAGVAGAALLGWRGPGSLRWWGLPLLLPALFWKTPSPPAGEMTVVVADVGQGQAVLVRTAQHVLLYDAGPRYAPDVDAGQRVVVPLLRSLGWRLDRLVLSHRDTDHTGGARAVLAMHPNADVLGSLPADLPWTRHPGYQTCEAGQRWTWDGVHFEVLHPQASAPRRAVSNASSCVLRIQAASGSLLLSGDIEAPEEAALVSRLGARLQTDVLLVPHHGSKTSSSLAWLAQVQPQWAWVQAGYRNRFGHPAQAVVARYQAQGIGWLETAGCGAIIWSSQTPQAMTCERAQQARYWHHRAP